MSRSGSSWSCAVPVVVGSVSAGAVGAWFFWRYRRTSSTAKGIPRPDPKADPCGSLEPRVTGVVTCQEPKVEAKVSVPEDIQVDFCVEGELQQCEHTLTVVQSLTAERGSKNAALDTALGALNELVPAYAAKLQDKRWLFSHAAELENTSEALQLLLLADDEQNLEAAAKSGRDIPELLVAAQALAKILSSGNGCSSGGCGSSSGCCQKTDKATSCASGGCGSCKNQGSCKSQSPQVEVNADGVVRLSA